MFTNKCRFVETKLVTKNEGYLCIQKLCLVFSSRLLYPSLMHRFPFRIVLFYVCPCMRSTNWGTELDVFVQSSVSSMIDE